MTEGSQKLSPRNPYFLHLKIFLLSSALYAWLIFCFNARFKEGEVLQNFLKWLPAVNSDSPVQMMWGVVTLHIIQ